MPKQFWSVRAVFALGNGEDAPSEETCNIWLRDSRFEAEDVEALKEHLFPWIKNEMGGLVDQVDHNERMWGFVNVTPVTKDGLESTKHFSLGVSGFWLSLVSRGHKDHRKFLLWELGLGPNPTKTLVK